MKHFRKILFPFAMIYGAIVFLRNKLFDVDFLRSKKYSFPVICIGNLSVGGTGKSPMVEHLIEILKENHQIAVLSRGYKRATKGFLLLSGKEKAEETGDEPLQFKTKFPEISVAVDENRQHGIAQLRKLKNPPEIIVLDDAFQHRKVSAGLNILLTTYGDLYCDDLLLPAGNLREPRSGAKRADIVVVTKCPASLSLGKQQKIRKKLDLENGQKLFFSTIVYHHSVTNGNVSKNVENLKEFTLVTGIANPKPLLEFLHEKELDFHHLKFPDHHHFKASELEKLREKELIVTTEKDFMRLKNELPENRLFFLPIKTKILGNPLEFEEEIKKIIRN